MKQLDIPKLTKEIITIYEKYIEAPDDEKNREEALALYNHYYTTYTMLPDYLVKPFTHLSDLGAFANVDTKTAKKYIEDLKQT